MHEFVKHKCLKDTLYVINVKDKLQNQSGVNTAREALATLSSNTSGSNGR